MNIKAEIMYKGVSEHTGIFIRPSTQSSQIPPSFYFRKNEEFPPHMEKLLCGKITAECSRYNLIAAV